MSPLFYLWLAFFLSNSWYSWYMVTKLGGREEGPVAAVFYSINAPHLHLITAVIFTYFYFELSNYVEKNIGRVFGVYMRVFTVIFTFIDFAVNVFRVVSVYGSPVPVPFI